VFVIRGPKQGVVDVYAGKTKIGRIKLTAATWRRDLVTLNLPSNWTGTLTVKWVSGSSRIDAVAVLR
jgi:hypothetical protein